ncbi:hypothetical protein AB1285_26595 [Microbacterium sp. NRRL B-14842]|uniref:hypothetical protein n=1 Tax=Microbacterium sp. NRRL B-14842 TaxID=3162881 RepID=UPI003D2DC600
MPRRAAIAFTADAGSGYSGGFGDLELAVVEPATWCAGGAEDVESLLDLQLRAGVGGEAVNPVRSVRVEVPGHDAVLLIPSCELSRPVGDLLEAVRTDDVGAGWFRCAFPEPVCVLQFRDLDAVAFRGGAEGVFVLDPLVGVVVAGAGAHSHQLARDRPERGCPDEGLELLLGVLLTLLRTPTPLPCGCRRRAPSPSVVDVVAHGLSRSSAGYRPVLGVFADRNRAPPVSGAPRSAVEVWVSR